MIRPERDTLRWGFVGTGTISRWMGAVVRDTPGAELAAVASRNMETAASFAQEHDAARPFDSWSGMLDWEGIDAVYVATPTALREQICIGAAEAGKHVLGEKPFASLSSLQRITAACRQNGVGFMDGTHFVHHPRHSAIREAMEQTIGHPQALESSFLVNLPDRDDIRYDPDLEPLGALGDLGWYNLRATIEYLAADAAIDNITARLRRDEPTGAIIGGEGSLRFADGTSSDWRCAFDAPSVDIGLELRGGHGTIRLENFVGENEDGSAGFRCGAGDGSSMADRQVRIESPLPGPALMFRDFARMTADPVSHERWQHASERTQALLDVVLGAAED